MKTIVNRKGGYYVNKRGSGVAAFFAIVIGVGCAVMSLPLFVAGSAYAWPAFLILGLPTVLLAMLAARKRTRIIAVLDARQVAGGIMLRVMDKDRVTHDVLTDEATSQGLAHILTGRTGIQA